MAQNEMRAMRGMPLRVRSSEGLGLALPGRSGDIGARTSRAVTLDRPSCSAGPGTLGAEEESLPWELYFR